MFSFSAFSRLEEALPSSSIRILVVLVTESVIVNPNDSRYLAASLRFLKFSSFPVIHTEIFLEVSLAVCSSKVKLIGNPTYYCE